MVSVPSCVEEDLSPTSIFVGIALFQCMTLPLDILLSMTSHDASSTCIVELTFITSLSDTSNSQAFCPTPVQASAASTTFGSLVVGTARQNTANYPILVNVVMNVASSTAAVILVGVGSTATPTAQTVVPSFTVAAATRLSFSFVVPSTYYAQVTTTGTITVTTITTFASQIG